jgi:diguanylate cyclase (GGDEF)-like protein
MYNYNAFQKKGCFMKLKKRLHFGVLFSSIDNTCQCKIWEGVVSFAKKHDIHLTAFLGTYQPKDTFVSHYETCFETMNKSSSFDGIILYSGFVAEDIGGDEFNRYIAMLPKNVPLVSVSFPMKGIPSVLVDNEKGIFDVVEHLIFQHNKKNIAFVKGPDGHPEAEARLDGYKKALEKNGLTFNKKYVLPGHFSTESGKEAIVELIDNRKIPFDAVVASDDETAIGVIEELDIRNVMVPTTVAVTGFDDDYASETHIPSLSTARQTFFEIGMTSANALYKQIRGEEVAEVEYVSPLFIQRQSCGCLESSVLVSQSKMEISSSVNSIYSFVLVKLISVFPGSIPGQQIHSWATALVERIICRPFSKKQLLHLFNEILICYRHYSRDFSVWYEVVNILFEGIDANRAELADVHSVLLALNAASALIYNINSKEDKCRELALGDAQWLIRQATNKLVLTFDIDSLCDKLQQSLPELSIYTAIIGLYSQAVKSDSGGGDKIIEMVIGFDENKKISVKRKFDNPISFSDYSTITGFNFDQELRTLFFIPLFFNDEELGVALLSYNSTNPISMYETLRVNISTAVKGAELLSKVQMLSITDELTGLLNRRGFFQFSYSRISHLYRRPEIKPLVLFLDMDGLKLINDTHGHKEGDTAIAVCAKLLRDALREEDIIGRIGGDEFVVFSSIKTAENSKDVIMRIRKKFDEYNAEKKHPYLVSCSIGFVLLDVATMENFDAAIQSADSVLYAEKMGKKEKGLTRQ